MLTEITAGMAFAKVAGTTLKSMSEGVRSLRQLIGTTGEVDAMMRDIEVQLIEAQQAHIATLGELRKLHEKQEQSDRRRELETAYPLQKTAGGAHIRVSNDTGPDAGTPHSICTAYAEDGVKSILDAAGTALRCNKRSTTFLLEKTDHTYTPVGNPRRDRWNY